MRYLLIIDSTGNLMLADVDKGIRMPIGAPLTSDQQSRVTMATWSAQGQWTAWSVDSAHVDGVREIRLHDEASDEMSTLIKSLSAFYLYPSPCGRWLSHLSPSPLGLELAVSNLATGEIQVIERGGSLFWAWSADSSQIAVHLDDQLLIADIPDGSTRLITDEAGPFVAPWWLPGGSVVYALGDQIVATGPDGVATALVAEGSSDRFSLSPYGRRLAYVGTDNNSPTLVAFDLVSRETTELTSAPIVAFFWSPEGTHLAALTAMGDGWVRWLVLDGTDMVPMAPFRPTRSWANVVLPFFEQYAQSHTPWSLDGTALVAPAVDDDGRSGAVIHTIESPDDAMWIPDAELVWWA